MKAEFRMMINGAWYEGINHPQSSVDALFPEQGKGTIEDVIETYGDDFDAILASAKYYRVAMGRGFFWAIEKPDGTPLMLDPQGNTSRVQDGHRFFLDLSDENVLIATKYGWKESDEAVVCFGARIED